MHGTNIKIFSIFLIFLQKKLKPTPDPLSFAVSLDNASLNGAVHQQQMAGLVIGKIQFLGNHRFHGL